MHMHAYIYNLVLLCIPVLYMLSINAIYIRINNNLFIVHTRIVYTCIHTCSYYSCMCKFMCCIDSCYYYRI